MRGLDDREILVSMNAVQRKVRNGKKELLSQGRDPFCLSMLESENALLEVRLPRQNLASLLSRLRSS